MESTTIQLLQSKTGLKESHDSDPSELIWYRNQNSFTRNSEKQLTGLNLCGQNVSSQEVQKLFEQEDLSQLKALNLSENNLTELTIPDEALSLCHLNVSENPSLTHLEFKTALSDLETLDASQCALETFNLPEGFKQLRNLDLRKNALQRITIEGDCPRLESLHVGANQLKAFSLPAGYGELLYLYLLNNQIAQLIFHSRLSKLKTLHLRNNQLRQLPPNFLSLEKLETLYLHNNPLPGIPKEVIASGERENSRDSVWDYLKSIRDDQTRPLHQSKMILVGNGEVGKTSIRIKLLDKDAPLPEKDDRTQGLDVIPYTIKNLSSELTGLAGPIDYQMNIWDFGGQGRYREVQQLFCSRKSLYLFVTAHDDKPEKQDYVGFEYWLSMVNAYGYDQTEERYSPVIHVVNKIDESYAPINQSDRLSIFPNIHPNFIQISCLTLDHFEELEKTIREVLPLVSQDVFTNQYSQLWMEVKDILEKKNQHHIPYPEYNELCLQHQMNESEARTWMNILDRVGTVIYFGDHPALKDWVILNPGWVKDAIYKVLDSDLIINGKLISSHYKYIWPDNSPEEHEKFVALMVAYKLAFEQQDPHGQVEYIIPALLSEERPAFPPHLQQPDYQIKLVYEPFIPAGTVNKLIVSLQENKGFRELAHHELEPGDSKGLYTTVYTNLIWKNNVVIHDPENHTYAHLKEVWEDHAVYLDLYGTDVLPLYHYVVAVLKGLNQDLKNTKYLHHLSMKPEVWYKEKWWNLAALEELGINFFQSDEAVERGSFKFDKAYQETGGISNYSGQQLGKESDPPKALEQKKKILFLAANPSDQSQIKTNPEHRKIKEQMERGLQRDRFEFLPSQFALTLNELIRAFSREKPNIIHFSGHGDQEGIIISTEDNKSQILSSRALGLIFKPLADVVEIVILNSCYSSDQACEISKHGAYVVGNKQPVKDQAAISFAVGFYIGLGEGKDFFHALNDGMIKLAAEHNQDP